MDVPIDGSQVNIELLASSLTVIHMRLVYGSQRMPSQRPGTSIDLTMRPFVSYCTIVLLPPVPVGRWKASAELLCGAVQVSSPEAASLSRTAQIQPRVFFTIEAPYLCIVALSSNCLEDLVWRRSPKATVSLPEGETPVPKTPALTPLISIVRVRNSNFEEAR